MRTNTIELLVGAAGLQDQEAGRSREARLDLVVRSGAASKNLNFWSFYLVEMRVKSFRV